jgi:hypothetical protein
LAVTKISGTLYCTPESNSNNRTVQLNLLLLGVVECQLKVWLVMALSPHFQCGGQFYCRSGEKTRVPTEKKWPVQHLKYSNKCQAFEVEVNSYMVFWPWGQICVIVFWIPSW